MHLWCNLDMVDQGVPSESLDDVCGPQMFAWQPVPPGRVALLGRSRARPRVYETRTLLTEDWRALPGPGFRGQTFLQNPRMTG